MVPNGGYAAPHLLLNPTQCEFGRGCRPAVALLRTGRHIQKHVGLSDTALNGHSRHVAIDQLHDRLSRGSRVVVVVKPRRGYGARAKGALTWMQQHWCPFMLRPACEG